MYFNHLLIILLFGINSVNCAPNVLNNMFNFSLVEFTKTSYFRNTVQSILDSTNFVEYFDESQSKCNSQIMHIVSQQSMLNNTKLLPIIDAWGKLPAGILEGKLFDLGNFDECMKINITTDVGNIKGQYCLIGPTNPPNLKIGICVPDSCAPHYLNDLLNYVLNNSENSTIQLISDCQINVQRSLDIIDVVMLSIFCVIIFMMITSTVYDLLSTYFRLRKLSALLAFSICTNGKKIFATNNSNPSNFKCLDGIRVLSLIWVIVGHVYALKLLEFTINLNIMTSWLTRYYSMIITSATVAVDSFLLISGLLVTMKIFEELKRSKEQLNIMAMYFHRYIRIAPANAALILFTMSLYRYLGHGPISNLVQEIGISASCEKFWWTALLYAQNYINPTEICLIHTWYLSVDMQLFLLSPLILLPLWKYGKIIFLFVLTFITFSIFYTFYISYVNRYTWNLLKDGGLLRSNQMVDLYLPTHLRMSPWLIGIILGYTLYTTKTRHLKLNKWFLILGWISSLLTIILVIFGPYNMQQLTYKEHLIESAIFISFHRVAWSIALAWIIFACVSGYGSFINTFLSWNIWTPFARLSYSMYLLHIPIQLLRIKSIQTGTYFNDFNAIHTFWGDFGLTLTASVFWVLAFESPILILEKIIINK